MLTKTESELRAQTGPLALAELGRFGYRDGVWYLEPRVQPAKPERKPGF